MKHPEATQGITISITILPQNPSTENRYNILRNREKEKEREREKRNEKGD